MKTYQITGVMLASLFASTSVWSSDIIVTRSGSSDVGLYAGAKFGNASHDEGDDSDVGFDLFAGFSINEVLAVEGGFADLGKSGSGTTNSVSLFHVGILGKNALSNEVAGFAKAGLAIWDADFDNGTSSDSDSGVDVFFGAGIDYEVGARSLVRFSIDLYSFDEEFGATKFDESVILYSVGAVMKF